MKKYIFLFLSFAFAFSVQAQDKILTLENVINIAKDNSPDALISRHQLRSSYWEFKTYKRGLLPALSFEGVIPNVNRGYTSITNQDDGTESYIAQSYVQYEGQLKLDQQVSLTGGNVFLQSGLRQTVNYSDSSSSSNFLSTPINIGFNQPLFKYNPYKWQKKIEPIKYQIAKKVYLETVEQVTITSIKYFFNLLVAQVDYKIAQVNVSNYDTLYKVAKGRYELGRIGEDDVLQMELSLLKATSALEKNEMELDDSMFRLKSFLRIKDEFDLQLVIPDADYYNKVDKNVALEKAMENSSSQLDFDKRLLEAQAVVNEAKTNYGLNANLYAVFGLTQNSELLRDVYGNPQDQQQLTLGVQVPILDWGQRKGKVKMAQSNEDLVKTSVEQERIDFIQSIYLKVAEYNIQRNQLLIAAKSDTVAQKSYTVSKNRYLIGKIGVTDLNISQNETDLAKVGYIRALQNYWFNYYNLRKSTLFDFGKMIDLDVSYEDIYED